MRKTLFTTLIIFSYNIFIILLPFLIFLLSLSLSQTAWIDAFTWYYLPFLLLSPVLTLGVCTRMMITRGDGCNWLQPIIVCLIGFIPLWGIFFFFSGIWNTSHYLIAASIPVLLGFSSFGLAGFWRRIVH